MINYLQLQLLQMIEDVSSQEIKIHTKGKQKKDNTPLTELGTNAINQLQLKVDMAQREDVEELSLILVQLLSYPNSDLAKDHCEAMKLGSYDLRILSSQNRNDTSSSLLDEKGGSKVCPCCGFIKQHSSITIGTPFEQVKNMGVSTYLYFSNYKKLSILLLILTVIYSIFALITNVIASRNGTLANSQSSVDYIAISLSSKQTNDNTTNRRYYLIQCWLGVVNVIVWIFVLAALKFQQVKDIKTYDDDTISCSDYSVVMQGMPLDVTQNILQKQLDQFYQDLKKANKIPEKWNKPFKIAKLNIGKPFYLNEQSFKDQQIENINKELQEGKQKLIQLVLQRRNSTTFSMNKEERKKLYDRYRALNKKKMEKMVQISNQIKKSIKEHHDEDKTTTVFVTFQTSVPKTFLAQVHEPSVLGRIQSLCGKTLDKFWYKKDDKFYHLEIRRAPQPQDIIWTNLGQKNCNSYMRKLFTFTVTLLLLGICFGIVYGLSKAQQEAGGSRPITIAISMTISIVNVMLGQVIRNLTVFEKDYTETYRQASLAIKSVLAQMINTILIPIITAYYVKNQNFYYQNGLVDNIFLLSISTILVPPILLLINPFRILMGIIRCVKSLPKNKLQQSQKQHNILHEGLQFEVGYQSIYMVSVFMFACFFVSLQPIISVIAMFGYLLMYWIEKYSLFNRYRRPVPGTDFVNNAVYKMISFAPAVYSFGSLTWANFSPTGIPPQAIVPNLIALSLSVILFIIPFNTIIVGLCMNDTGQATSIFEKNRIFMPSQYDRLNPSTQAQGFEDYKKYMEKMKEQLKNANPKEQAQIAKRMALNNQRGQMMNHSQNNGFGAMQSAFNFMQPQPAFGYGYGNMMAPMMNNYSPMNMFAPSSMLGFGYAQPPQFAPQQPIFPPAVNVPPNSRVPQNQPPQIFQPQVNPINMLAGHNNASINQNVGLNQSNVSFIPQNNINANPFFVPQPASNMSIQPFGSNNFPNNAFYGAGNQPQGRRW